MTQHPSPPLGGDEAKVETSAADDQRMAFFWQDVSDNPRGKITNIEASELIRLAVKRTAAPVLPVEVREKIARIISPDAFATRDRHYAEISALVEGGAVTEDQAVDLRRSADAYPGRAFTKADRILSTIKGDA